MSEIPSSCVLVRDAVKRKGGVIQWRRKIQHDFWNHLLSGLLVLLQYQQTYPEAAMRLC